MERFSFTLFLLLMMLACSSADETSALIQFKQFSIESDPNGSLTDWLHAGGGPCSFSGVFCSPAGGQVSGLNLSNLGLIGRLRIDPLLALPALRYLDLHGNLFYGNLSYIRGSSPCSLETADFSANNISGVLAGDFLASCPGLVSLNLSKNSIVGGVFPYGSSLQRLDLSGNRISDNGLLNYSLTNCSSMVLLNFSGNELTGELTAASSCGNLATLDLSHNVISGAMPSDFISASPASLRELDLSHNNLSGELKGFDFGGCGGIATLDLSSNRLDGHGISTSLANCQKLERLVLSGNGLGGGIPTFFKSFAELSYLSLADNKFAGEIPQELGLTCGTLAELDLSGNKLTGALPSTFVSCSSLQSLDLGNNQLSGDLVGSVISTMSSLRFLNLGFNNISGTVPLLALRNCTSLEAIDLSSNEFTGEIPVGFCSSLPFLWKLLLPNNFISGTVPVELSECKNLQVIDLSFNNLAGPIPIEVWFLPKLSDLIMWANNLSGEIPKNLCSEGGGASLETLILSHNDITGSIPPSITKCANLIWVSLSGNRITGEIPAGVGNLQKLAILQLGNNSLSGPILPELGNCRSLIWLDLNSNELTGPIPPSLASQTGLVVPGIVSGKQFAFLRNAAGNVCPGAGELFEFEGIRPERLASFPLVHSCPATRIYTGTTVYSFESNGSMIYLDLSYNSLSGAIPENFGFMDYLQVLNLGHNRLSGTIPKTFGGLKRILGLDLSHNGLSGSIPGVLGTLTFLDDLDVSNNNLAGPIPASGQLTTFPASRYDNNSGLCGPPMARCGSNPGGSNAGSRKRRFSSGGILIGVGLSLLIALCLMLVLYKMRRARRKEDPEPRIPYSRTGSWKLSGVLEPLGIDVATFEKPLRRLTFAHLLEATNGFSADSLIGSGGFGDVYKARLEDGSTVAIKKLIHVTGQGDREFTAEMETIGKIKHRNLVPLLGYCRVGDERLLVYEYMSHGSLDVVLHDKNGKLGGSLKLDWAMRKKIAAGAARGLAFLHHSCIPHIIHRDMKSSNVLLDEGLEARVSDFGMARLMNAVDTHLSVSTLAGTPGYVPPEYYQSFRCTTKGDVYSYGVILLELVSGKKPIDPSDFGDNNLVGWAKQMVKENRSAEIFDCEVVRKNNSAGEAELYRYLKVALECLDDRPMRRPTMIQVMAMFKELQADSGSDFLVDGFSLGQTIIEDSRESKQS